MGSAAGRIYRSRSQAWLRGHDDPFINHVISTSFCAFGTKNYFVKERTCFGNEVHMRTP